MTQGNQQTLMALAALKHGADFKATFRAPPGHEDGGPSEDDIGACPTECEHDLCRTCWRLEG